MSTKDLIENILKVNEWLKDLPADPVGDESSDLAIKWFNKDGDEEDAAASAALGERLREAAGIAPNETFSDALVDKHAGIFETHRAGACAEAACAEFRVIKQRLAGGVDDEASDSGDDAAKVFLVAVDHVDASMSTFKHVFTVIARPSDCTVPIKPSATKFSLLTSLHSTALVVDYWFNADQAYDFDEDEDWLAKEATEEQLAKLQNGPKGKSKGFHHQAAPFKHYRALAIARQKFEYPYDLSKAEIVWTN